MKKDFRLIDAGCREFPAVQQTFLQFIQPTMGPQEEILKKIGEGRELLCEGLFLDDVLTGFVVYEKNLVGPEKVLRAQTMTLVSPQADAGKGFEAVLTGKLKEVARQRAAEQIVLTLPACRLADISLLERAGFIVQSEVENPHKSAEKLRVLGYKVPAMTPSSLMVSGAASAAFGGGAQVADLGNPERKRRADDAAPGEEAKKRSSDEKDHVEKQAVRKSAFVSIPRAVEKAVALGVTPNAFHPERKRHADDARGASSSKGEEARLVPSEINIRTAKEGDLPWVKELMHSALSPYYDGDHAAHAERIFQAHIRGGKDSVGFFSQEQRMFIAEVGGVPAGLLHVVGKRQDTYKISPLIIDPAFRGKLGLGSCLLRHAEEYAKTRKARQLYCTVAEQNVGALNFFRRKDFIKAGSAQNHYKQGVQETVLYKDFTMVKQERPDTIAVCPLDEHDEAAKKQIKELIGSLKGSFMSIDADWEEALFSGYSRRETADVNTKYKLIYVAKNESGRVVGVVGATPKKGTPIKIMPCAAVDPDVFTVLLENIKDTLKPYGHKLYIHINPDVSQVIALQKSGWIHEACMPAAYHREIVTQQWGFELDKTAQLDSTIDFGRKRL